MQRWRVNVVSRGQERNAVVEGILVPSDFPLRWPPVHSYPFVPRSTHRTIRISQQLILAIGHPDYPINRTLLLIVIELIVRPRPW